MQENNSLLPVLYTEKEENSTPDTEYEKEEYTVRQTRKNSTAVYLASISLCILAVFSFLIYMFTNANSFISAEAVLGYIASDFLGIDPSSDDRNIYEILMSGSFGDANSSEDGSKENTSIQDTTSENNAHESKDTSDRNDTQIQVGIPPDSSEIPEGEYAIVATDLSSDTISISNQTEYEINIEEYINSAKQTDGYTLKINNNLTIDPVVLIIHTHGTEAYSEEGSISYSENTNLPRSEDITKNVVAVGAEMARVLNQNGIPTLHCEIMHDKESYKNSYSRAAETIKEYLEKYPSIQYVFDVHRDSIISESKVKYKPVTSIDGEATAQIMAVMGSDFNSEAHTNWRCNLTLALKFTELMNNKYENMMRTMSLRASSYNQEYTKGSMLLEIGSCGNTLSEAKRAAQIAADTLSELILEGW